MAERAKRVGARLDISGPRGEGTTVQVTIPYDAASSNDSPTI
jgi:signal transduction histidine kinase